MKLFDYQLITRHSSIQDTVKMNVHIKISDRGWILERMAQELAKRLSYVTFDTDPNGDADIQYYLTYSAHSGKVSPIELAYFTHVESDAAANQKFFDVAKSVDHCVCQSEVARDALSSKGTAALTIIPPGVDLDRFTPLVRVGVIGRTYHTGRKGEHLVAQVTDVPGIEWLFTGVGWPGPSSPVPDDDLPSFYRTLDYVLVPALNEGGPMCVLEALACGVPVIAPPIGWVPKFPHIEYRTGDAGDLRRVLSSIVKKKQDMHATVQDYSWDKFASAHDKLFKQFQLQLPQRAARSRLSPTTQGKIGRSAPSTLRAVLVTHGIERQTKGGPSVRVPMTAEGLRRLGIDAKMRMFPDADLANADLVHVFNAWQPETALSALKAAKRRGRPTVLSPIYLDLSARHLWEQQVPDAFRDVAGHQTIRDSLSRIREQLLALRSVDPLDLPEPAPGYYARLWELVEHSDHIIFLSDAERTRLCRILGKSLDGTVIRNPAPRIDLADPELFAERFGVRDYVLCVGRLERRKNQLMLAYALRNRGIPLVLIGHSEDKAYLDKIKQLQTPNLHVIERLPPGSDILASAFAGARVFTLPSWAEGAPLAALEAARLGIPLVVSNLSGEAEYFGDFARYCNPGDPEQIAEQIVAAYAGEHGDRRRTQSSFFEQTYSLERHCEQTLSTYHKVCEQVGGGRVSDLVADPSVGSSAPLVISGSKPRITLDLTSTAYIRDHLTGITRVEQKLADFLKETSQADVGFCAWRGTDRSILNIDPNSTSPDQVKKVFMNANAARSTPSAGGEYLLAGGAWMQNPGYVRDVVDFCRAYDQRLNILIYDLIPVEFPFWSRPGYSGVFEQHLQILLEHADRIMAISKTAEESLHAHCAGVLGYKPEVTVIRLGDDLAESPTLHENQDAGSRPRSASLLPSVHNFALCVGAIHGRKNYQLLYAAWLKLVEDMQSRAPHLVIVGGTQIGGDEVRRAFEEDKRINQYIHVLDDANDDQLADLYRRCAFTLYPSLAEGWGLPVAESLNHGKICLASDIPSIREFVPDARDLLDPTDLKSWVARIRLYATSQITRRTREDEIRSCYVQKSWRDTTSQVVSCIRDRPVMPRKPAKLYAGEIVPLTERRFARPLLDRSFASTCTTDARGLSGTDIAMRFRPVARGSSSDLEILLRCRCDQPVEGEWQLTANGHQIANWRFGREQIATVTGLIRASTAEKGDIIELRVAAVEPHDSPGTGGASQPSTVEITGLCLLERTAGEVQTRDVSMTLSRRSRALVAVGATATTSAVSKTAGTSVISKTITPPSLAKRKKKKRGPWKQLKRALRKSVGAIGRVIQRTVHLRIKIKVKRIASKNRP
jgi:glycosyltransferase involved in cell wall biosynthesis